MLPTVSTCRERKPGKAKGPNPEGRSLSQDQKGLATSILPQPLPTCQSESAFRATARRMTAPAGGAERDQKYVGPSCDRARWSMIDRNHRARLLARLQADRSLTLGARAVGRAIVCLCDRSGRTVACYDRIARTAGVDRRTVARALPHLGRYVGVHRRRALRAGRNGGQVMANLVTVYTMDLPAAPKGQPATGSTVQSQPLPMDPGLAAVLTRLGVAIANRQVDRPPESVHPPRL